MPAAYRQTVVASYATYRALFARLRILCRDDTATVWHSCRFNEELAHRPHQIIRTEAFLRPVAEPITFTPIEESEAPMPDPIPDPPTTTAASVWLHATTEQIIEAAILRAPMTSPCCAMCGGDHAIYRRRMWNAPHADSHLCGSCHYSLYYCEATPCIHWMTRSDAHHVDGGTYCPPCAEGLAAMPAPRCTRCDIATRPLWRLSTGYTWNDRDTELSLCSDCRDNYYGCENGNCGAWVTPNEARYLGAGEVWCPTCYNNTYSECPNCSEDYVTEHGCDCDDTESRDGCTCPDCRSSRRRRRAFARPRRDGRHEGEIHFYSYRPSLVFNGAFRGSRTPFFGMEIEVTAGSEYGRSNERFLLAGDVEQAFGDLVYLKEDSSINHGFEIVTHPFTYAWAMENIGWDKWAALAEAGLGADDSTGIHVHVSRKGFAGASHTYRWLQFFYRNAEQVMQVARRRHSHFARFNDEQRPAHKFVAKGEPPQCGRCISCRRNYGYCDSMRFDRYSAINLSNPDTFEVRVFASTVNAQEIQAALGLVAASIEYTRGIRSNDILTGNAWSWTAFAAWVAKRPEYAPLAKEIEKLCVS